MKLGKKMKPWLGRFFFVQNFFTQICMFISSLVWVGGGKRAWNLIFSQHACLWLSCCFPSAYIFSFTWNGHNKRMKFLVVAEEILWIFQWQDAVRSLVEQKHIETLEICVKILRILQLLKYCSVNWKLLHSFLLHFEIYQLGWYNRLEKKCVCNISVWKKYEFLSEQLSTK